MALRQHRHPFLVSDTSTVPRSCVGTTRRLANAYSAVGSVLLAAAMSTLHPRVALVAALGVDSIKMEEVALHAELVDLY